MAKVYASKIVKKAISYIGTKEIPANSNNVKFNTDYYGHPVCGAAYPWCCTFVWDIFRMCKASELFCDGEKTAYCPYVESWGKKEKLIVKHDLGKAGDLVLFDFNHKGLAGHIGIIEKHNADGTYTVIEGNTSLSSNDNGGTVMRRTRGLEVIRCIIRPKYKKKVKKDMCANQQDTKLSGKYMVEKYAWLRKTPGLDGAKVEGLVAGTVIECKGYFANSKAGNRWLYVKSKNNSGYVVAKKLTKVTKGKEDAK